MPIPKKPTQSTVLDDYCYTSGSIRCQICPQVADHTLACNKNVTNTCNKQKKSSDCWNTIPSGLCRWDTVNENCVPAIPCYFEKWPTDHNLDKDKVCEPIEYIINNNNSNVPYTNTGIPCESNQEVFIPIDSDYYCETNSVPLNKRVFAKATIEKVEKEDGLTCKYTLKPFNYFASDGTKVQCSWLGGYQYILPISSVFENRTHIIGV